MRIDRARNKEKIRSAAIQILAKSDIERIPLEEIARKASVTRATLYNHYGSREELLSDIVLEALAFISSRIEGILLQKSPSMEDLMNALYDLYQEHREALELGGCKTLSHNAPVKRAHQHFMTLFLNLLKKIRPKGFPLGQELSLGLISRIYIPVLQQVQTMDNPEIEKRKMFLKIMKGALSL